MATHTSTVVGFGREAQAHAHRFVSHLADSGESPTPELVRLWQMVARPDLSEGRSRVAAVLGLLIETAALEPADVRLLSGLAYLRLQYLLGVQGAGTSIDAVLSDPLQLQARLTAAFAAIEPDLFAALTVVAGTALRKSSTRAAVEAGCQHVASLSMTTVELAEAADLPAYLLPVEHRNAASTTLTLGTLVIVNLWPNKTNTPNPKFPGGGGDGGAPKPK